MEDTQLQQGNQLQHENAVAYNALATAIDNIMLKLGFQDGGDLYMNATPPDRGERLPPMIFETGTLMYGIVPKSRSCKIICVAEMSHKLFWEHFRESLGLSADTGAAPSTRQITIHTSSIPGLDLKPGATIQFFHSRQDWSTFEKCRKTLGQEHACIEPGNYAGEFELWRSMQSPPTLSLAELKNPRASVTQMQRFRHGYLVFRRWADLMGLFSDVPEYGYLSEKCLCELFRRAALEIGTNWSSVLHVLASKTFQEIIEKKAISVLLPNGTNLAANVYTEHKDAIISTIADGSCTAQPWDQWPEVGVQLFSRGCSTYLKYEAHCWNLQENEEVAITVRLLLEKYMQIVRNNPKLKARLWPRPLKNEQKGDYLYLIGLQFHAEDGAGLSELLDHVKDANLWESYHSGWYHRVDHVDEEEAATLLASSQFENETEECESTISSASASAKRFRFASEAMSRLCHDEKHMYRKYEIGYLDRFEKELLWKDLDKWVPRKHSEADDFVPIHRVQKIRTTEDKSIIWDRANKTDNT
ncbi:Hypothetical predicted protein [Lecanosticta acicola]|uniref:MJ1316 RNA cyclic group end recognition domain-containing protein n=1 Tax=Lecanosticta acicola TaxID=111012 RepID=A0AAI8W0U5_9PEZI|nr:Hypothetical predicted protein [Lecanosticta acicola]